MAESGNWFSHDANKDYQEQTRSPRLPTEAAKEMYERSQGTMNSVLNHENRNGTPGPDGRRGKGSGYLAQEVAKKNVKGIIMKYLIEDENVEIHPPRPMARVKSAGEDNYVKNQGDMSNCLSGYPETPVKHSNRRIKPEGAENAQRNKGTLDLLSNDYGNNAPQHTPRGRRGKLEVLQYAERNNGTIANMRGDFENLAVTG